MRNAFIEEIIGAVAERDDIFVISGDAGLGVFDEFKDAYADRFLNLGVAEQNMIGFAAGMALDGVKVVVYNIIPFVLYRCFEQVRNDICYQELSVVLVGIGSGLTYSPQGMTHYSIEDVGIARTLPNLTTVSPCDPVEARAAARFALGADGPVYVRLAKRGEPDLHPAPLASITGPIELGSAAGAAGPASSGASCADVAILFHGSVGGEVLAARDVLAAAGIGVKAISVPMVQPLSTEQVFSAVEGCRHVVTVEEHYMNSGLGAELALACAQRRPSWQLHRLGVAYEFVHDIRSQDGMRDHFGISAGRIAEYVAALGAERG